MGEGQPPSKETPAWRRGGDDAQPGPIALPRSLRGKSTALGWILSVVVVALAVVVYFATRPTLPPVQADALPTWGSLSLAQVAQGEARSAGDAHPTQATWMFTHSDKVMPILAPGSASTGEAEYVVSMRGRFHAPPGTGALAGSQANGSVLVVLVRAFDGSVSGWLLTSQAPPGLPALGITHPLSLGGI